jgi:hypothetical protein
VLRVHLHEEDAQQRVAATAVGIANWKNWVPAWFSFLHDRLTGQAGLSAAFLKDKRPDATGRQLVNYLLSDAHAFVASQKGFAAELVSQHVVGDAVNRFLSSGLDDLSDEVKLELFPSLEIASTQIRAGGRGTLALVSETRKAITQDIATFNADYARFIQEKEQVGTQIGKFNADYTDFQTQRMQIVEEVATLKIDVAGINTRLVDADLGGVAINRAPTDSGGGTP